MPVFIYVGRLIESKKVDQLIYAFKNVNKHYQLCNLLIVGSGPEEENLKSLAKNGIISKINHLVRSREDFIRLQINTMFSNLSSVELSKLQNLL